MTRVLEWKDTRKDRKQRQGGSVALHVNDQLKCKELCLGMEEELAKSLWVRIKRRAGTGNIIVRVFYRNTWQIMR